MGRENYHLTLAFLGEQGPGGVEAARRAVMAMEGFPAPTLAFAGLGFFPMRGAWRVLVMRLAEAGAKGLPGEGRLAVLHEALNERLAAEATALGEGVRPLLGSDPRPSSRTSRPFEPHITLARNRTGGVRPRLGPAPEFGGWGLTPRREMATEGGGFTLGAVVLYKSELRPRGALYTELEMAKLAPI